MSIINKAELKTKWELSVIKEPELKPSVCVIKEAETKPSVEISAIKEARERSIVMCNKRSCT